MINASNGLEVHKSSEYLNTDKPESDDFGCNNNTSERALS